MEPEIGAVAHGTFQVVLVEKVEEAICKQIETREQINRRRQVLKEQPAISRPNQDQVGSQVN